MRDNDVERGDLVMLCNTIIHNDHTFRPEEIGVVLEIEEPRIQFPAGIATVQYEHGVLDCYWSELEIINEKQ